MHESTIIDSLKISISIWVLANNLLFNTCWETITSLGHIMLRAMISCKSLQLPIVGDFNGSKLVHRSISWVFVFVDFLVFYKSTINFCSINIQFKCV